MAHTRAPAPSPSAVTHPQAEGAWPFSDWGMPPASGSGFRPDSTPWRLRRMLIEPLPF